MRTILISLLVLSVGCGGCGRPDYGPCGDVSETGEYACTLEYGGLEREYLLHVPEGYSDGDSVPLVVSFHGRKGRADQQAEMTRFSELADAEGFAVVHPNGYEQSWNAGTCCGDAHEEGVDDIAFVRDMVAEISSQIAIDERRIYATGLSNGARMTYAVGCEASDLFAAIAPVVGPPSVEGECEPDRPVPIMHIAGTADECNPYLGGDGPDTEDNASIPDTIDDWASRNECADSEVVFEEGHTTCTAHTGCSEDATVELCAIEGGGHIWPGAEPYLFWRACGGEWYDDFDATQRIWRFFEAHPMR